MSVFNSLGSNYDFKFVFRNLFPNGHASDYQKLVRHLSEQFDGKAYLFYKGREALQQALVAAGLSEGSQVAINGFTCFAVEEAVQKAGLSPVYLDIDKQTLNFTAETLEEALKHNPAIKAVIIQNTLGYPCDIAGIEAVTRENNLILIEDLAHSIGLEYDDGRKAGTVGDFTMLSFGRDKVIDAVAGGALIVRKPVNENWLAMLKANRNLPGLRKILIDRLYPLSTWAIRKTYASGLGKAKQILLSKVGMLPKATDGNFSGYTDLPNSYTYEILNQLNSSKINNHRKDIADTYRQILPNHMVPAAARDNNGAVELRFPVYVKNRSELLHELKQAHINIADIWYDSPIAPPRFMKKTSYKGECPNSEIACASLLNLPTHRNISEEQAKDLAERIASWQKSK